VPAGWVLVLREHAYSYLKELAENGIAGGFSGAVGSRHPEGTNRPALFVLRIDAMAMT
jgi:hypothetical protein